MPVIRLETHIKANRKIVFDLSRSIDFQSEAVKSSNERAVAGKTSGLIGLNETVTWHGKHLGVRQHLTTRMTDFDLPNFFADEMEKGAFKSIRHEHYFSTTEEGTLMKDVFKFRAPLGILGWLANKLFLKSYMTNFLKGRNRFLKEYAESGRWREVLPENYM
ncbi:SRPBCC family protein [Zunongwangia sp. F260]|uniref:SRPBCC family protein n=1 Tax=Autumnicola lenta TaxID=3075593 RepID=A0ABU3CHR7_9FLAO|nr:SRPBCC family protein [Zunongwangia sp. F260]MDT0645890.1 SRPBCC family protein [Zunongwangia sp. F260]